MKYWMAVASREHVLRGVSGGFCQVCHGKGAPLKQMAPNDWIIYYSPTEEFQRPKICRAFTAIGRIQAKEPYLFQMSEGFIPWRRDVAFLEAKEAPIEPLIEALTFIQNKKSWGFPFRRGYFAIPEADFELIKKAMHVKT